MPYDNNNSFKDRWRMPASMRTQHAISREQQRSIPSAFTELVLDHAKPRKTHRRNKAFSYSLDRSAWQRIAAGLGERAKYYERARDIYVITSADGTIITVAWRR